MLRNHVKDLLDLVKKPKVTLTKAHNMYVKRTLDLPHVYQYLEINF